MQQTCSLGIGNDNKYVPSIQLYKAHMVKAVGLVCSGVNEIPLMLKSASSSDELPEMWILRRKPSFIGSRMSGHCAR